MIPKIGPHLLWVHIKCQLDRPIDAWDMEALIFRSFKRCTHARARTHAHVHALLIYEGAKLWKGLFSYCKQNYECSIKRNFGTILTHAIFFINRQYNIPKIYSQLFRATFGVLLLMCAFKQRLPVRCWSVFETLNTFFSKQDLFSLGTS